MRSFLLLMMSFLVSTAARAVAPVSYDGAVGYVQGVGGLPTAKVQEMKIPDPDVARKLALFFTEESCNGAGCSFVVFKRDGSGPKATYEPVGHFTGQYELLPSVSSGLPDIEVSTVVSGERLRYTLTFSGTRYIRGGGAP